MTLEAFEQLQSLKHRIDDLEGILGVVKSRIGMSDREKITVFLGNLSSRDLAEVDFVAIRMQIQSAVERSLARAQQEWDSK